MASSSSTSTPKGRKTPSAKRSTTKAASTKPVAATKARTLKAAQPPKPVPRPVPKAAPKKQQNVELSKQELLERITTESGMKKGEARAALDAVLTALRGALAEGLDISAAPLGKIRLVRKKDTPNGELAVLRVKLKDPAKLAKQAVARDTDPG